MGVEPGTKWKDTDGRVWLVCIPIDDGWWGCAAIDHGDPRKTSVTVNGFPPEAFTDGRLKPLDPEPS